ncbi:hypothetical protein ARMGADRAFT_90185 [Armillaria gallica]|uniref:Peptidase C14 caspase domain-containing protein n=1 Tax=Armillaria gallica TaxID=47427 RepID=A0A2H3E198_ARMGA|nr:hypothetical protein ARMGADRAFT_90185 [Armillaria gallica]
MANTDIRRHFTNGRVSDVSSLSEARKSNTHIDVSRFWALIIGIDTYNDMPLKGCVSDALSVKEYITKDLGVAQDHVFCLVNESATRVNIINALCRFYSDTRILYNDIIIIYFAGHGSSYPDPDICSDGADHAIEAICSIDRGTEHNGTLIPDISDREFNSILSLISRAKGHRITVLLDCCHCGSHSRCSVLEGVRTIPPLKHDSATYMLRVAHDHMRHYPGYRSVLDSNWRPDMDSHIILAAARGHEYAREVEGDNGFHGVFTYSLLHTLRSENLAQRLTYVELLHAMPVSYYQTPVVAGCRINTRILYQD